MRIKISVDELRIGMHVDGLDRPWLETPFLFQDFVVGSQNDIAELRKYCRHVYITVPDEAPPPRPPPKAPRGTRASTATRREQLWQSQGGRAPREADIVHRISYDASLPVEKELPHAQGLRTDFRATLDRMYDDARMGRSVDTGYAKSVIGDLTDSVLRNPDAHMLLSQLKLKDDYAASHSMNVCSLALAFGRHLGMPRENLEEIGMGAMLIDVGNLRLPREILGKPGPLSAEEMEKVREHPALGMEMLLQSGEPPPHAAIEAVYTHHERMDGSGYPRGLRGNEIPLYGRMVAIVDVYDAATSDRAYRHGHPPSDALRDLYNSRKGQFDERLVEQFIQCLGIYPVGSVLRCSTGELGIVIAQNPKRRLRPKLLLVRDPDGRPFPTPKILDLSKFGEGQTIGVAGIVDASDHAIDVAEYLGDLSWLPPARDSESHPARQ